MILRDKPLFRTLARMPSHLIPRAFETIAAIETAFPNLPGQDDEFEVLPPHGVRWRRRVGDSAWWVYYSFSIEKQVLILRTVNERP